MHILKCYRALCKMVLTHIVASLVWLQMCKANIITIIINIPRHCIGVTHSFLVQSMIIPKGHSHPLVIQMRGQKTGPVLLHAM